MYNSTGFQWPLGRFYDCFLLFHLSAVFSALQQFLRYLLGSAAAPIIFNRVSGIHSVFVP